jgi:AsmA protein
MRKALLALGILVGIVVIAVLIFAATFDVNSYHDRIQSELETQLGRKVTLGQMHLGLFPPRFRVQDLAIADDPSFNSQRPFVQTSELDVSVKLLPLLHKDVEVDSINLFQPRAELIKNRQGIWNFASLGKKSAPSQPSSSSQTLSLGELTVKDGQVALTDQKQPTRSVYDHIDLTLRDFAPNHPFSVDVAAHLPGTGAQEIQLQGKGGPIADNPVSTPFDGTLALKQVTIAGFQQFLNNPALVNTDGVLSGETKISSQGGKVTASGHTSADNVKVHGIDLGYPIVADYDVTDDLNSDLLTLRGTTVKLGSTPLTVNGTVNSGSTPAKLDVNVKAANVSIADAVKLAAASGVAFAPGVAVTGTVNADIHASGTADQLALNGSVNGRDIQASGKDLAKPVQVNAVNLALTPAEIRSDNFNVNSGNTNVAVQFALRQYMTKTPTVDAAVKAPNAGLPEVLSMAKAYGVTSLNNVTGEGTLNLDLRAAGPVASVASNAIMKAVNGTIALAFNNVKYTGSNASSELSKIAGFLKPSSSGQSNVTNISKLTGNIAVKSGIAQTNNLQAVLDIGNLGVVGTANLVDQTLNLHANAVLSKESSQQAGGTSVGGFMQTALANNNGELVIPVIITGTFQQPRFAPDVQQLAQMKLKGIVPNFSNPSSAVSGLLGGFLGQKTASPANANQSQQQQQQQQANPVQQLMGIFGKKKQQPAK